MQCISINLNVNELLFSVKSGVKHWENTSVYVNKILQYYIFIIDIKRKKYIS